MSTIFYTPSQEDLIRLAKEHPELSESIKQKTLDELLDSGLKFSKDRIKREASTSINKLFNEVEKKYISKSSWSNTLSKDSESQIKAAIDFKFSSVIENSINDFINSDDFKLSLSKKIKEKTLSHALAILDDKIKQEALKLTT